MEMINFISNLAMPFIILLIVAYGLIEKKKVFDVFLDGAKEGLSIVLSIFPTLVGLFVANKIVDRLDGGLVKKLTYVIIGLCGLSNVITTLL